MCLISPDFFFFFLLVPDIFFCFFGFLKEKKSKKIPKKRIKKEVEAAKADVVLETTPIVAKQFLLIKRISPEACLI